MRKASKEVVIYYYLIWIFTGGVHFVKTLQDVNLKFMHFHVCIFFNEIFTSKKYFSFCTDFLKLATRKYNKKD